MRLPSAVFPDLENAGVLITGGASGIGAALVEGFAAQGAKVAFIDIDASAGNAVTDRLSAARHKPLFLHADLTDLDAMKHAVAEAGSTFGGIRVLVNNAAWDDRKDIDDLSEPRLPPARSATPHQMAPRLPCARARACRAPLPHELRCRSSS